MHSAVLDVLPVKSAFSLKILEILLVYIFFHRLYAKANTSDVNFHGGMQLVCYDDLDNLAFIATKQ